MAIICIKKCPSSSIGLHITIHFCFTTTHVYNIRSWFHSGERRNKSINLLTTSERLKSYLCSWRCVKKIEYICIGSWWQKSKALRRKQKIPLRAHWKDKLITDDVIFINFFIHISKDFVIRGIRWDIIIIWQLCHRIEEVGEAYGIIKIITRDTLIAYFYLSHAQIITFLWKRKSLSSLQKCINSFFNESHVSHSYFVRSFCGCYLSTYLRCCCTIFLLKKEKPSSRSDNYEKR